MAGICCNLAMEHKNMGHKNLTAINCFLKDKIMRAIQIIKLLPENASYDEFDSPVGELTIVASNEGLHAILWDHYLKDMDSQQIIYKLTKSNTLKTIVETKKQLNEYFAGMRTTFDIPMKVRGTDFQMSTWQELSKIPYGEVISYKEQATRLGDKNKARAVGMANGLNPISIIVPCHRVIGSNGSLTGFGGGMDRKEYLLQLERRSINAAI